MIRHCSLFKGIGKLTYADSRSPVSTFKQLPYSIR